MFGGLANFSIFLRAFIAQFLWICAAVLPLGCGLVVVWSGFG